MRAIVSSGLQLLGGIVWATLLFALPCSSAAAAAPMGHDLVFESDVRPILKARCFVCHGEGDELKGKLDLRLKRTMLAGGKDGPVLAPGDPSTSLLYQKLVKGEMPKGKAKLPAGELETIRRWIAAGAPTARPEPAQIKPGSEITAEEREFWSFQPIRRPEVPKVKDEDRVRTPIDALVIHRLEERQLRLSPEADKLTLIRRATFDLTGLPATPQEIDAFVKDGAPDAYEKLIDRLLASPHYGEHWGRHWLDTAGYADSDGYVDSDPVRKFAYRYRDYVIRAFNDDKPFDQFIREQLAGDEMVRPPYKDLSPEQIDKLAATGFLRMAPDGTGAGADDQTAARNSVVADTIKVVSTSLLGLTVGCAQCHSHKYDPIPQTDYYRLRAVFEPAYDPKHWRPPQARLIPLATDKDRADAARIEAEAASVDAERKTRENALVLAIFQRERAKVPPDVREAARTAHLTPKPKRTKEQSGLLLQYPTVDIPPGSLMLYDPKAAADLAKYTTRAAEIRAKKPAEQFVQALTEVPGVVPVTYLFARGDPEQPKQAVTPGELSVISDSTAAQIPAKDPSLPTTGRRLAYAKWLTSGKHPLVARVLVNRIWMHHFGRGIVGTPGDFGALGERPSNPELLDWLADEFMASGWRLKAFQKQIMMSSVYRQSFRHDPAAAAIDPDNRLLWHAPVRRLEAESVRDSVLAVSGRLNPKMFGPPIPVALDSSGQTIIGTEMRDGNGKQVPVAVNNGDQFRRSVYIQVRRTKPLGILEAFDEPQMTPNCDARTCSTVATQSLTLMNSDFVIAEAKEFALRLKNEAGSDPRARIELAWRLAFGRPPTEDDVSRSIAFLAAEECEFHSRQPATTQPAKVAAKPKPAVAKAAPAPASPGPQLEALTSF
ncbi:MAG TPA: PSD1 and planctomycete cytochrome C domain-containing protein, partial [Tepidisphaeraceae bacterium]|nr:PSD1 and planctomycete cytochrome C domain-containing protein [Tepidisphaeraceae bacterium]